MENTYPCRILSLAGAIRHPWPATLMAALGSVCVYLLIHELLHLPFPMTTGVLISATIPVIVGHPIILMISTQNRHIQEQNRQLEELNQQKNILLSMIAHDMRSPLASLKQTLDYVAEDEDYAAEALKSFPALNTRVGKTLGTLDNLLSWSRGSFRPEAGSSEGVPLQSLIDSVTRPLQETRQEKQLTLHKHFEPGLVLHTRADLLTLVLHNLISNAVKYTPDHGRIDIRARKEGRRLCLSISDSGVGMDQATLDKLFTSTHIASQPGTRGETGSGIGLLLCKQLLHSIGGSIRAESRPGLGSTFHVCLPRRA